MRTGKQLVALDCDGVLADFDGYATKVFNEKLGTSFTREDWKEWHPTEKSFGEHAKAVNKIVGDLVRDTNTWEQLSAMPDAREHTLRLLEHFDVVVLTSMPVSGFDIRERWLAEHISSRVGLVLANSSTKLRVCASIGAIALADDRVDTIRGKRNPHRTTLPWLIDRPYNLNEEIPKYALHGTLGEFVRWMEDHG